VFDSSQIRNFYGSLTTGRLTPINNIFFQIKSAIHQQFKLIDTSIKISIIFAKQQSNNATRKLMHIYIEKGGVERKWKTHDGAIGIGEGTAK
jgi:hypothetical protein